jgi:predicted transcriptional regulator
MTNSQKFLMLPGGRSIVLSIKPQYAELILSGTKTVEFRRAWAAESIDTIVIYASAPIQKLVGIVRVTDIVRAKPTALWSYCSKCGGGLSKSELLAYLEGKDKGFAVLLRGAKRFSKNVAPETLIKDFSPPQSFRYLTNTEARRLEKLIP